MAMDIMSTVSLVLNLVFGGGLFVTLVTLRDVRKQAGGVAKKAVAEAKKDEIENVEAAIKIWRDMAESMVVRHEETMAEVAALRREVNRLRVINNRIVKLLDKITPENLQATVERIKQEMDDEEAMANSSNRHSAAGRVQD